MDACKWRTWKTRVGENNQSSSFFICAKKACRSGLWAHTTWAHTTWAHTVVAHTAGASRIRSALGRGCTLCSAPPGLRSSRPTWPVNGKKRGRLRWGRNHRHFTSHNPRFYSPRCVILFMFVGSRQREVRTVWRASHVAWLVPASRTGTGNFNQGPRTTGWAKFSTKLY